MEFSFVSHLYYEWRHMKNAEEWLVVFVIHYRMTLILTKDVMS